METGADRKEDPKKDSPLHPDFQPGMLLLANSGLEDPNFVATVVLVCHHNEEGTYGLVLNRPSHMPLSEVFNGFSGKDKDTRKIYIGGPVQPDELQILQVTDEPVSDSYRVSGRVHLGGHWSDLDQILEEQGVRIRLFLGYSGWGPGQLQTEVAQGAWEVRKVELERLLLGPEEPWLAGLDSFRSYLDKLS